MFGVMKAANKRNALLFIRVNKKVSSVATKGANLAPFDKEVCSKQTMSY
jgi:hypothetical protein